MYSFDHQAVTELAKELESFVGDLPRTVKLIGLEKALSLSWEKEKSFRSHLYQGCLSLCRVGEKSFLVLDEMPLWCEVMNLHKLCVFYLALESLGFDEFIFVSSAGAWNEDLKVTDCVLATDVVNLSSIDPFMGEEASYLKVEDRREIFSQSLLSELLNSGAEKMLKSCLGPVCFWEKRLLPSPRENALNQSLAECYSQSAILECLLLHGLGNKVMNIVIISHQAIRYQSSAISSSALRDAKNFAMQNLSRALAMC